MSVTVNGYEVLTSNRTTGPLPRLRKVQIPDSERYFYLRDGSCALVLAHAILLHDETVERIDLADSTWDEWGWGVRPVRGQTSGYSNHAGGVAADVNATKHPRGTPIRASYTDPQIARVRLNMKRYGGAVIWGGEWPSHPGSTAETDGMHYELAGPAQGVEFHEIERLALALCKTKRGQRILNANPGLLAVIKS